MRMKNKNEKRKREDDLIKIVYLLLMIWCVLSMIGSTLQSIMISLICAVKKKRKLDINANKTKVMIFYNQIRIFTPASSCIKRTEI